MRRLTTLAAVATLAATALFAAPASAAGGSVQCTVYDLTTKLGFDYTANPGDC